MSSLETLDKIIQLPQSIANLTLTMPDFSSKLEEVLTLLYLLKEFSPPHGGFLIKQFSMLLPYAIQGDKIPRQMLDKFVHHYVESVRNILKPFLVGFFTEAIYCYIKKSLSNPDILEKLISSKNCKSLAEELFKELESEYIELSKRISQQISHNKCVISSMFGPSTLCRLLADVYFYYITAEENSDALILNIGRFFESLLLYLLAPMKALEVIRENLKSQHSISSKELAKKISGVFKDFERKTLGKLIPLMKKKDKNGETLLDVISKNKIWLGELLNEILVYYNKVKHPKPFSLPLDPRISRSITLRLISALDEELVEAFFEYLSRNFDIPINSKKIREEILEKSYEILHIIFKNY